ncbi:MAG: transketolase C-terminal domain-containing protein [Candidatus Omnitrophota bacterium]|jgi:pyruvate dehydrogenase E1 component beta subunit
MRTLTYKEAISEALVQGMEQDPDVFIFGLGVDDYKGIFGTTRDAFLKFGPARVFDTPASENALTGIMLGAALNGKRPVMVHARHDFMFLTLDQLINNASKWKYVYAGKSSVPCLIRGIVGKGWGQGVTHSQNIQAVCAHFPGLYVVVPSTPYLVKGLISRGLRTDSPVLILESRALYDTEGPVPEEAYEIPFGKAHVHREGRDLTVVATSLMIPEALKAAEILSGQGIEIEVIDPVCLQPIDAVTLCASVRKTGRLICVDNDWLPCGFSAEVAALAADQAFSALKAPVKRIGWVFSPCPVSKPLEEIFYPSCHTIIETALEVLARDIAYDKKQIREETPFLGPY